MDSKSPSKEDLRRIQQIIDEKVKLENETHECPIIANKVNKRTQFKINIPKKFADFIELNKKDYTAKITLEKTEKKIIVEIIKR